MERLDTNQRGRGTPIRGVPVRGVPVRGGYKYPPNQDRPVARPQIVKRHQEKAHLSALISTNKSFALQRLMRDYNEIKNQVTPTAGVSAMPLENDFFEWHGNIKANTQNAYKGAVLHFRFTFPKTYPINPPQIFLLNENLTHPNILPGGAICLDMLEVHKEPYRGWTSGYSVLSILLQLQNFFFDVDETTLEDAASKKKIINEVRAMNEFNCKVCKHKGSGNPWPDFNKFGEEVNTYQMTSQKYKDSILNELVCYHRKTTFEETPLGLGIKIQKITRTGEIKGITPTLDFISLKSYTKEQLRTSMSGDKFTHWFPLYFGAKQEQFIHLCKNSISMICAGNTKSFSNDMVLKVMPKFFTNLVTDIIAEKTFTSCRALKVMIYVYRVCSLMLEICPNMKDEVESMIYKFINDPESRRKESTPSLGDLLTMLTLSSSHKIEELLAPYMEEQMDRQILWIIQALPEFENLINSSTVDNIRAQVCFKSGIVGNQILLFYYYFIKKILCKDTRSIGDISKLLDENYCNLTNEVLYSHQKEIQKILKIDSYHDYYKFLNLSPPNEKTLNDNLKNAYNNSLRKGYHGKDEVRFVPNGEEQIRLIFDKFPKLEELVSPNGSLINENDSFWENLVCEKFDIVKKMKYELGVNTNRNSNLISQEFTPVQIAKYYEDNLYDGVFKKNNTSDFKKKGDIQQKFNYYKYKEPRDSDKFLQDISWRGLYFKLYLETYIKYFRFSTDFKQFYSLLDLAKNEIKHLNLYIYDTQDLKSDYNYIRALFTKLNQIKHFHIIIAEELNQKLCLKIIKNLLKGLSNLNAAAGEIQSLKIWGIYDIGKSVIGDIVFLSILDKLPHLKYLDISGFHIGLESALKIRNHLYYFKTIESLNLSNCCVDDQMAKEIADGIMKAKALEKIFLRGNNFKKGLANVLYNLAFQPCLKVIDISENTSADPIETGVSLYKLIKMSGSLEYLICRGIRDLLTEFTNEFYYSLGDNSSLVYLDLSQTGMFRSGHDKMFASAVALNAKKNGALKTLILSNINMNQLNFAAFIEGMSISEETHFTWYGTAFDTSIVKDSKAYYEKKFYCKIQHLDLSHNVIKTAIGYHELKYTHPDKQNVVRTLLENNLNLEYLNLSSCWTNKFLIESIADALQYKNGLKYLNLEFSYIKGSYIKILMSAFYKENEDKVKILNENIHLEGLNFARNRFGYSGIELISSMLKDNKTVKYLNLYKNIFDINGARRLKSALEINNTLEWLDISYNRIKDSGFTNVVDGILANKNNNLKFLSCRYNFVKNSALASNLEKLISHPNSKIQNIELSRNSFDEKSLLSTYENIYNIKIKENDAKDSTCNIIRTDIFEVLYRLTPERLERTVWITPVKGSAFDIYKSLQKNEKVVISEDNSHIGIPISIGLIKAKNPSTNKKVQGPVVHAFIEFIHPNSVNRLLKVAASNGFTSDGSQRVKVFKAGTRPERLNVKVKK